MIENIKGVYYLSKAYEKKHGEIWYKVANKSCGAIAKKTQMHSAIVVGVLSALSPNNKWERNIIDTENICMAYKSDIPLDEVKVCTYNANREKAIKILGILKSGSSDLENDIRTILNGNKVKAFFDCIYNYETNKTTVCIDGHAKAIYIGEKFALSSNSSNVTNKQYRIISQAYINATKEINESEGTSYLPYQIQAITWVAWRRIHNIK
tara:strand:+ start:1775 stop:2401 length:627 start_codon:yes stop_codon:yes gene_type:complete